MPTLTSLAEVEERTRQLATVLGVNPLIVSDYLYFVRQAWRVIHRFRENEPKRRELMRLVSLLVVRGLDKKVLDQIMEEALSTILPKHIREARLTSPDSLSLIIILPDPSVLVGDVFHVSTRSAEQETPPSGEAFMETFLRISRADGAMVRVHHIETTGRERLFLEPADNHSREIFRRALEELKNRGAQAEREGARRWSQYSPEGFESRTNKRRGRRVLRRPR